MPMGFGVSSGPRGGTHRDRGSNVPTPRYHRYYVTHAGSYCNQLYSRQLRLCLQGWPSTHSFTLTFVNTSPSWLFIVIIRLTKIYMSSRLVLCLIIYSTYLRQHTEYKYWLKQTLVPRWCQILTRYISPQLTSKGELNASVTLILVCISYLVESNLYFVNTNIYKQRRGYPTLHLNFALMRSRELEKEWAC